MKTSRRFSALAYRPVWQSKQRHIADSSINMYHFGLICIALRMTPDHICLLGSRAWHIGVVSWLLLYVRQSVGFCNCQDVISLCAPHRGPLQGTKQKKIIWEKSSKDAIWRGCIDWAWFYWFNAFIISEPNSNIQYIFLIDKIYLLTFSAIFLHPIVALILSVFFFCCLNNIYTLVCS